MVNVKVEQNGKYTYVRCSKCNEVLATNDQSYFLRKFHGSAIEPLGSCDHFEVIEVHKDPKSAKNIPIYEKKAVMKFEFKKYVSFIVPRES